jgi:predicted hotdog family 3-hydroxylacyl-ACP dehydratase
MIAHDIIEGLIPHKGSMCLLDRVLSWDEQRLVAATRTHLNEDNPLRERNRLRTISLFEYGAQAMAIHGALLQPGRSASHTPTPGMLVSLRNVTAHCEFAHTLPQELVVEAERLHAMDSVVQYVFRVRHSGELVIEGNAVVALQSV